MGKLAFFFLRPTLIGADYISGLILIVSFASGLSSMTWQRNGAFSMVGILY